jgi:hypothetical protein
MKTKTRQPRSRRRCRCHFRCRSCGGRRRRLLRLLSSPCSRGAALACLCPNGNCRGRPRIGENLKGLTFHEMEERATRKQRSPASLRKSAKKKKLQHDPKGGVCALKEAGASEKQLLLQRWSRRTTVRKRTEAATVLTGRGRRWRCSCSPGKASWATKAIAQRKGTNEPALVYSNPAGSAARMQELPVSHPTLPLSVDTNEHDDRTSHENSARNSALCREKMTE